MDINDIEKLNELALSVLRVSRNTLVINLRFMDSAISRLTWVNVYDIPAQLRRSLPPMERGIMTEGTAIVYDPVALCRLYAAEKQRGPRAYLHMVLHCVFRHFLIGATADRQKWDIACDMAVEGIIDGLGLPAVDTAKSDRRQDELQKIAPHVKNLLTAEKIYHYLQEEKLSEKRLQGLSELFGCDDHGMWYKPDMVGNGSSMADKSSGQKGNDQNDPRKPEGKNGDKDPDQKPQQGKNGPDNGQSDGNDKEQSPQGQNGSNGPGQDQQGGSNGPGQDQQGGSNGSGQNQQGGSNGPGQDQQSGSNGSGENQQGGSNGPGQDQQGGSNGSGQNQQGGSNGPGQDQQSGSNGSGQNQQGGSNGPGQNQQSGSNGGGNGGGYGNSAGSGRQAPNGAGNRNGRDGGSRGQSDANGGQDRQGDGQDRQGGSNGGERPRGMDRSSLEQDWRDVAEHLQMDMETFSKQQGDMAGGMMQNLREVNREKYDYTSFLKKFAVMGEAMKINQDEFDYVFYTYGMKLFPERRMPLIEPLEYKEVKRIREFVIAIDTSGSVAGDQVQSFLQKTYNILKSTESFFSRINLHILQCDADVQEHVKITNQEEFDRYLKTMTIKGLGGTDFRPVFKAVDVMVQAHEFSSLKGLIYFTDGYGTFPEHMPDYKTAFVFVQDGYDIPEVPVWAMRLVLQKDEMEGNA